jgi:hypothetical protein
MSFYPPIEQTNEPKSKGEYRGFCNRTACQSPNNVIYFNHSTRAYYCPACAALINEANYADAMRMFGHELCTIKHPINEQ